MVALLTGLGADGCSELTDEDTCGLVPIWLQNIVCKQGGHLESMGHSDNSEILPHSPSHMWGLLLNLTPAPSPSKCVAFVSKENLEASSPSLLP